MVIKKIQTGSETILELQGRLNTTTAPLLEEEMGAIGTKWVLITLDLAAVDYVSSAGIRVILSAHKKLASSSRRLVLKNTGEGVMEVFSITGLSNVLNIE